MNPDGSPLALPLRRAVSTIVTAPYYMAGVGRESTQERTPIHPSPFQSWKPIPARAAANLSHQGSFEKGAAEALPIAGRTTQGDTSKQVIQVEDDFILSEPSADLRGLVEYFNRLIREGIRITEVTHVVNSWTLIGFIPMRHHGFVLRTKEMGFLTLDFSRRGILWDTFNNFPEVPEGTFFVRTYAVNLDPRGIMKYCQETPPFSWTDNNCSQWASGALKVFGIKEEASALRAMACFGSSVQSSGRQANCLEAAPTRSRVEFGCTSGRRRPAEAPTVSNCF